VDSLPKAKFKSSHSQPLLLVIKQNRSAAITASLVWYLGIRRVDDSPTKGQRLQQEEEEREGASWNKGTKVWLRELHEAIWQLKQPLAHLLPPLFSMIFIPEIPRFSASRIIILWLWLTVSYCLFLSIVLCAISFVLCRILTKSSHLFLRDQVDSIMNKPPITFL